MKLHQMQHSANHVQDENVCHVAAAVSDIGIYNNQTLAGPQSPDRSSLRFVGSDHGIHITESAENFFSRIGRE